MRTVLIDDCNEPSATLDIEKFTDWLKEQNALPDYLVMESALVPLAPLLLKCLPAEHRAHFEKHFQQLGKVNCSFLVAVWQLCRLGELPTPSFKKIRADAPPFLSEKTLTVLPRSYEPNEQKALDIIKPTPFAHRLKDIKYMFFD